MALGIELAVLEELTNGQLLAAFKHLLKQAEGDLGDEKFVVVSVVTIHLLAFTANFINTVVISAIQLL